MNCFEIEEHLLDYVDNELSGSMQQVVAEHLQTCLACRKEVENYRKTAMLLQLRAVPEPPENYWDQSWEKIRAGFQARVLPISTKTLPNPARWKWLLSLNWRPLTGVAAMFLLIIAAVVWSWQTKHSRQVAVQSEKRIYLDPPVTRPVVGYDDNLQDDMSHQINIIYAGRAAFGSIDPISKSVMLVHLETNKR